VVALFTLLYFWVFTNTAQVLLVIETPEPSLFRIYWADRAGQYRQTREAHLRTRAGEGVYRVDLADLSGIRMLRLDPSERRTRMTIRKMVISQQGFEPLSWEKTTDWEGLTVLQQIEGLGTDGGALSFETVGGDAQLALPIAPRSRPLSGEEWSRFFLLLALLLLALHLQNRWGGELRAVPAALALATGLALCMAMLTPPDRHPDEWAHLAAGQYYEDRWLPPKICDPETRHTFSVYGASRLLSNEIVYLLAGKFSYLIGHLPIPFETHQRLRLFNVLLLAGLLGMTLRHAPYRFLCLPLLISPQIWYIFSYFNSEAFALGVTLLWTRQVFDPHSALHRLWDAPARAGFWNVLGLGVLFGLALLIKKNFHIVGLFLLIEALRHFIGLNGAQRRRMVTGSALLLVVGMGLLGIKLAGDWSVNGFRQRQAILRCREQMAAPAYRSDTPLAAQYALWHLRQRGVGWREILDRHRWGEKSFRSAFGVYGYTSISASPDYYRIVKTLAVLLGGYLAVLALRRSPPGYRATLAAALACALALTAALFWHAWTGDMQAQGRYFLPVFIFLGALLYRSRMGADRTIPNILTVGLFLLSVYSFVLLGLAKTSMAG
jgi:hypothetical protein